MSRIAADGSKRKRVKCIVLGAAGAGKTSILRRYFNDTFSSYRVPTQGSDFYTGRVKTSQQHASEDEKKVDDYTDVSLQVWDTAGRERFVAGRKAIYTAALSDEFFQYANACMLVYDATSSTSFTQLLKWHSDLMRRMKQLQIDTIPILIVANKMDILKRDFEPQRRRKSGPRRRVMGLEDFKGKDMPYEYRASPPSASTETSTANGRRVEISTYMATGDTWTTDQMYVDSVLNTEDISHPDRDMVLLWCMRNGLTHMEVSALDGTGIDAAMECLVSLALEAKQEPASKPSPAGMNGGFHSNKPLDLHQRYSSSDDKCKCWHPIRRFCK
eukprot:CAMPEP_0202493644 /NCGR_PEP_ID=MMETSP1361-20130828/9910_1 /ASSEMBLY_ACC=CAM_ASM_000849 /TAXON_ID=210615 /ORGANISM="Staurosira complex sp., Strain CCMP2646" /LENGTH=328 /DNA_ID=CAMNT_0049123985 /DNA_START=99 /DNA_END=1085 /DNA_ORIENTATION=-